jgi:3-oxoadipate CoA-transferase, alpha subunit
MIDKAVPDARAAIAGIGDGATLLAGGFGGAGIPNTLFEAILAAGVRDLTVVSNNAGVGRVGLAALIEAGRVRRIVCSYPRVPGSDAIERAYRAGRIELEIVPQGTLAERMRAAGAGLGGFYTPTSAGTLLAAGKETRVIGGRLHVFEPALHGDFALVKAWRADRFGNLVYRKVARNLNPIVATAAAITIAEVDEVVPAGALDPESIATPGIYVDRVLCTPTLRYD